MHNTVCDALISGKVKVVVLEDSKSIQKQIKDFIEQELEWEVLIAKNRDEAHNLHETQGVKFYILDINLGDNRRQEGIDTAQDIKEFDENTYIAIFSGFLSSRQVRKSFRNIKVNHLEEKSENIQVGFCNIAMDMLKFQKDLVSSFFKSYFNSTIELDDERILKLAKKEKEINQQIDKIQKLEICYQLSSAKPLINVSTDDEELEPEEISSYIAEDENIKKYKIYKRNEDWLTENAGKYVAFVDGEWIDDFVEKEKDDLLKKLDESIEYRDKPVFYIQADREGSQFKNENIPRLSSSAQFRGLKFLSGDY